MLRPSIRSDAGDNIANMDARLTMIFVVSSIALMTTAVAQATKAAADIPILTVCEVLQDLAKYDGKQVVIVGRLTSSDEGTWLDQDCEHKIVTEGYTWPNIISTTYIPRFALPPPDLPSGFQWDEQHLQVKLDEVTVTTKLQAPKDDPYSDKWVAQFGRLDTRQPLRMLKRPGGLVPYGFGHVWAAPAQLISPEKGVHELKAKVGAPRMD